MACLLSLSFPVPLYSVQNPFKLRYPKKSAYGRVPVPGQATTKTASYFQASCSSNIGICSASSQHYLTTISKHFDETISCSLNVSTCTRNMFIRGYWVGPDIDDGWGFIEAYVVRSS